jgi:hypothetical protein
MTKRKAIFIHRPNELPKELKEAFVVHHGLVNFAFQIEEYSEPTAPDFTDRGEWALEESENDQT